MKKMIYLMLALLFISSTGFAQPRKGSQHKEKTSVYEKFTPEQIATINSKRMTLRLDLNEKQQKAIQALELDQVKFKKSVMELRKKERDQEKSKDEKVYYERLNERLDRQIAYQTKLKDILNQDQYAIWKEDMKDRSKRRGQERKKRRRHSRK